MRKNQIVAIARIDFTLSFYSFIRINQHGNRPIGGGTNAKKVKVVTLLSPLDSRPEQKHYCGAGRLVRQYRRLNTTLLRPKGSAATP